MEKQEVSNYAWHYFCKFIAFSILLRTLTVHLKVSFIINSALCTPAYFLLYVLWQLFKVSQNIPVFENDLRQLFKITFPSLFNSRRLGTTHVNTNLHSFDSSKDRLDTKIVSHVSLQLSQKLQLPDRATRILNLVAQMKFLVAPGDRSAVNVEPYLLICTSLDW